MAQANNNEVIQELEREILSLKDQYDSIAKHDHAKIVSIVRMMLQKSTEIRSVPVSYFLFFSDEKCQKLHWVIQYFFPA